MDERRAVVIRYCGGCNPRYDRVGAVEALRRYFPSLRFVPDHPRPLLTILVCGCAVRCLDAGPEEGVLCLDDLSGLPAVAEAIAQAAAQ